MTTEIRTLDSKLVYKNQWMSVREDKIQRASGSEGIFGVVDKTDFVVIVPVDGPYIHLVEQYRYPVQGRFWELPQGAWETNADASPLEVAKGELQEETGLLANSMEYVGFQYLAYGYSSQGYHIYLASDFKKTETNLDIEEEGLITKRVTLNDFEKLILSGDIKDASSVNAYGLTKMKGLL